MRRLFVDRLLPFLPRLLKSHGHGDRGPDHRVVAHADEAHHLHMRRNRGRAGKLGIGVHPPHGVGHAVGSRAGAYIIRMEGATGAAAGGHREVFLALLDTFLLLPSSKARHLGCVGLEQLGPDPGVEKNTPPPPPLDNVHGYSRTALSIRFFFTQAKQCGFFWMKG